MNTHFGTIQIKLGGNILDATERTIVHQCNCTMRGYGAGLYNVIARKWPEAHIYSMRQANAMPGTVDLIETRDGAHVIACLYSQFNPGSGNVTDTYDSTAMRQNWFKMALQALDHMVPKHEPIAMPYNIGCGLAGGHWATYFAMIAQYAAGCNRNIALYDIEYASTKIIHT